MPYQIPQGIQQYLINLYQRFDKDPDAIPVLRIEDNNSQGYFQNGHLRLQDFRLTLIPGTQEKNGAIIPSNARSVDIDLTEPSSLQKPYLFQGVKIVPTLTIQEVYDRILAAGYQVSHVEPRFFGASATILAEIDETYDGRSFLSAATSVLWRILIPIALEGKNEREQGIQASRQFDLHLAEGKWLDRIGHLYGISRYEKESDNSYRKRIDFHVIRPHANNVALEYMVQKLFGFSSVIHDDSSPEWFYTDDERSLTFVKGMKDIHRTPPGKIPFFSVVVDAIYPLEQESPEQKLYRETGKNQYFYTDDIGSTTAAFGQDEKANVTPPGNRYYQTILENRDMLLIGTEAERNVYRSILQYKAAGSRFILRHRRQVFSDETKIPEPFSIFVEQTTLMRANNPTKNTLESTPPLPRVFLTIDTDDFLTSSSFREETILSAFPLVDGTPILIRKILSSN